MINYFFGGKIMNINLVEIDANKTIGKNPVLVDVAPSYVYENGKRTGEVSGFKYTVALPDKAFEKLTVKIDGECKLEKPDDRHYPVAIFDGLEMRPYWTPEGYKVFLQRRRIFVLSMRERLKLLQISLCMVCLKHTVQRLCGKGGNYPP